MMQIALCTKRVIRDSQNGIMASRVELSFTSSPFLPISSIRVHFVQQILDRKAQDGKEADDVGRRLVLVPQHQLPLLHHQQWHSMSEFRSISDSRPADKSTFSSDQDHGIRRVRQER